MTFHLTDVHRRRLDLFEQLSVLFLYVWLFARLWPDSMDAEGFLAILFLLISEGLVCFLLIIRRPTLNISLNLKDWLIAATGSFLVLLVNKGGDPMLPTVGACLLLVGLIIHLSAKLALWRSFGLVAANRGIKVGGLYAYVRHPMYAGYMLGHVGFLLASPLLWNAVLYAVTWALLLARMSAEEKILMNDPKYQAYARVVPYRVVPGIY